MTNATPPLTIEKNIPIPPKHKLWPFENMKPGDSFAISGDKKKHDSLRTAASQFGRKHGQSFTLRVVGNTNTIRCWRVS